MVINRDAAKSFAESQVRKHAEELVALSRRIHQNPELGFSEHHASAWLATAVEEWTDVKVTRGVAGLDTAFRAEAGTGELVVTICAEYDALPGMGHACGHNVIAASAIGAFAALAPIADDLGLTVRLLGTPAEEGGAGKITMLDAGEFDGTHAAMMIHPGVDDVEEMTAFAAMEIDVDFTGRESHASAAPSHGVNALDAMTLMLTAIGLARQQLAPEQQIHGFVRHAGTASNVIPGASGGTWAVRGPNLDSLQQVLEVFSRCAKAGALATGCEVTLRESDFRYADIKSDELLVKSYRDNAATLGRNVAPAGPRGGSTDMGNISQRFPTIHPLLGLGPGATELHSTDFEVLAGGPSGDRAAVDGALLLAWTAIDAALNNQVRKHLLAIPSS